MPKISVIMPVYNREAYINDAIDSVLNQTYQDFELIIIDDGSTDNTINQINSYDDSRIVLIKHDSNKGISAARNTGLRHAKGEFIVNSDSDDINLPTKFEEQLYFLEKNQEMDIVGCHYQHFSEEGLGEIWYFPEDNDYIKANRLLWNQQAPTSMIRRKKIEDKGLLYYDEFFSSAEDTEFFNRMPDDVKMTNIQKVLYLYRRHNAQVTLDLEDTPQKRLVNLARIKLLNEMGLYPSEHEIKVHYSLCDFNSLVKNKIKFSEVRNWTEKLITYNNLNYFYNMNLFKNIYASQFFRLCDYYSYKGKEIWDDWENFEYKKRTPAYEVFDMEKVLQILQNKKIAILGTLYSTYNLIRTLEVVKIPISYLIDNKIGDQGLRMNNLPIYKLDNIKENRIDTLILGILSDKKYDIKNEIEENYNIEVILFDDLI
ncbi:glycosyl transferase family 2 [Ureibacillus xyleni]|uniref:Glycosyl transferase family 2 n=1 Tax=Ureibacillus xyleni TaxID=614648 RepID=A0A285RFG0_9BACL|nr:glycosyltransferase family 2 protein [Ureibacillus xyleni]SOB91162.1 glycosyl transferase family 2 [Ureibacillus xyleni]